jgi:hypothetical protein
MRRTVSPWHWPALARGAAAAAITALATLSLAACGGDPTSPVSTLEPAFAEADGHASVALVRRPFHYTQQWEASGSDFTSPCIVDIPDPAAPGSSIQVLFPGATYGTGTASHWGRHSVGIYFDSCAWDADVGGIAVQGPANAVVASGDTVWATYEGYWYLSPSGGGDFVGSMVMLSGTGRFANVTGEATLNAHDELDGSGWDWGNGWIAY